MKNQISVAVLQSDICWHEPSKNREIFEKQITSIESAIDLIILPEMFTTGFTMEAAQNAIQPNEIRGDFKIDTILSGSTGIGKTYNTEKAFELAGVKPVVIQGNQSMFSFSTQLMLEHYIFQKKKSKSKANK